MKKFFSICALSIIAFVAVFAEEGQTAILKWQLRVPKSTSVIRYQLNDENADNWIIVHNTSNGIIELPVETPIGQDSVLYVQQSKDGVLWSESARQVITSDVVQRIYNKNHNIVDESSETQVSTSALPSTSAPETREVSALSPKTSAFAFTFLVKPQVNVNLQKAILVAETTDWNNWKTGKKLEAKDLAPRLDFEFGFQNIGGKKGDVAAFDIALNLGYEAAPYAGWNGNPFDKTFMDPNNWYHKTSLDVRLNLAFNSGVFRPYFGVGAGVMFTFAEHGKSSDNLLGTELFTLKKGNAAGDLEVKGYTYVLGALGFRFNCSSNFTIGIEGTYKLFVTGADTDHIWHAVDCGISLGGTWSI